MLPFSKRKITTDPVELTDDDLVVIDEGSGSPSPSSARFAVARPRALAADQAITTVREPRTERRKGTLPPGSRRVLEGHVEDDVADQCLASIAAETSRDHDPYSSSHIRAAIARPAPAAPPASSQAASHPPSHQPSQLPPSSSKLPSVSPPPFVRTTTVPFRSAAQGPEAPGVRESSPPPAFVRRSSPVIPVSPSSSMTSVAAAANDTKVPSVAPVSMTHAPPAGAPAAPNEPTVIVLRERPKAAWFIAAAALGALGALGATHLLPGAAREPAPVTAAPALPVETAPQPPSTVVVAPPPPPAVTAPATPAAPAPAAAPAAVATTLAGAAAAAAQTTSAGAAPSASGVVVRFGEDQGVAIKSPRRAGAAPAGAVPAAATGATRPAAPATKPRPSLGPALPDGSFGLGRTDTTPAASSPSLTSSPAAAAPAPEPPKKRNLTPEQQLAEAQLKASMK